jgi:adenylosuccinate synthase
MADRKIILVLSGEICTGKTTISNKLTKEFDFKQCKTKEGLLFLAEKKLKGKPIERDFLQKFGEELDTKYKGKWVLEYFQEVFAKEFSQHKFYVIDSVRILDQIKHLRAAFSYFVFHVHLRASAGSLEERFYRRNELAGLSKQKTKEKYKQYKQNSTEAQVNSLEAEADLVIDTDKCNDEDVFIRVASFLKLLPPTNTPLVDVLIGGQFGSEGKGQIAAHISPEYDCLLRVGGPNAGHTVYELPEKHVFHLLPSGTYRNPNSKLLIGAGAVLNIDKILEEIKFFGVEDANRLIIDENAIVIRQKDIEDEKKLQKHIGSTAQGVGFATANNITARLKAESKHKASSYVKQLRPYLGCVAEELEKLYRGNKKILLEGTQGSGLSLHHGLYPYVTSRDTSVSGCLSEAGISPKRVRKFMMVTRTYPIRVGGTSGPFKSIDITWDEVAKRSGKDAKDLKKKEITTTTKRDRRVAEFSWQMFRRACELNSPTDIALTFTDYISVENEKARRYDQLTTETRQLIEEIERSSGVKVSLIGTCFDYRAIIDRRNW